jgi:hypothetical protein
MMKTWAVYAQCYEWIFLSILICLKSYLGIFKDAKYTWQTQFGNILQTRAILVAILTCHHCTTHLFLVQSGVTITRQILRKQKFADWVSSRIAASRWKAFWKADIPLKARSLWYRLLHGRLHCQVSTSRFSSLNGARRCVWCINIDEDLQHLFIQCPQR